MRNSCKKKSNISKNPRVVTAFTLVEMMIVLAVIAILVSIVIISYSGWRQSTISTQLKSDLNGAVAAMENSRNFGNSYPSSIPSTFLASNGVTLSGGGLNSGATYCVSASNGDQSYFLVKDGTPLPGNCPVLYLDASLSTSYPGTGTTWYDLSGNINNGTLYSGVAYDGGAIKALTFNGTSSYIRVPNSSNINPATNGVFSISVWIKPDTLSTTWYRGILRQETYLASGYRFGIYSDGRVNFWTTQSGGTLSTMTTSNNLVAGQWANIVVVYDNQNAKIYINSVLSGTGSGTYISGSNNLDIGQIISENFSGSMAEIRLHNNKALSENDIKSDFNGQKARFGL